jgi:hypothetical protein
MLQIDGGIGVLKMALEFILNKGHSKHIDKDLQSFLYFN